MNRSHLSQGSLQITAHGLAEIRLLSSSESAQRSFNLLQVLLVGHAAIFGPTLPASDMQGTHSRERYWKWRVIIQKVLLSHALKHAPMSATHELTCAAINCAPFLEGCP